MEPTDETAGELVARITDDLKGIARDELAIARTELTAAARHAAADAAAVLLGATVALFGLGLLCAAAVVGLDAWIPSLAARMVLMAAVYLAIGAVIGTIFGKKLGRDVKPDFTRARLEARRTLTAIKEGTLHA